MTKQEFIRELKTALSPAPGEVRDEIISDISEHFSEGIAQGLTEEEICRNLGQPGSIAAQVLQEYAGGEREAKQGNGSGGGDSSGESVKIKGGYEISIDRSFTRVRDIDVSFSICNIRFVPADDDRFRVEIKGRSRYGKFTVENLGGKLVVKADEPIFRFEIFGFKSKLETTIYVPAGFRGDIQAKSAAGNISVTGISGKLNMNTAAGNVTINEHNGGDLCLRSAAGNIDVEVLNAHIGITDISTAAGNVNLTASETGNLKMTTLLFSAQLPKQGRGNKIGKRQGKSDEKNRNIKKKPA